MSRRLWPGKWKITRKCQSTLRCHDQRRVRRGSVHTADLDIRNAMSAIVWHLFNMMGIVDREFSRLSLQRWTRSSRTVTAPSRETCAFPELAASSYCCTHAVGSAFQRRSGARTRVCGPSNVLASFSVARLHIAPIRSGTKRQDSEDGDSKWREASVFAVWWQHALDHILKIW